MLTLALTGGMLLFVSHLLLSPASWWFEYRGIEPAQSSYIVGEQIHFISNAYFYKTVNVTWNDVLRCDFDEDEFGEVFFGVYNSNADNIGPSQPSGSPWAYGARTPMEPGTCHLDSTIVITLPFGIEKAQKLTSEDFRFEYESN